MDRAKLMGTGTFEGDLCLGEWEDTNCLGEMYSGSFDFDFEWQLSDPDPDPSVDTFTGKLVILQGYGGKIGGRWLLGQAESVGRTQKGATGATGRPLLSHPPGFGGTSYTSPTSH